MTVSPRERLINKHGTLDWDEINRRYRENASPEELAATEAAAARMMGKTLPDDAPAAAVKPVVVREAANKTPPEVEAAVIAEYQRGDLASVIGEKHNLNGQTVRRICRDAGVYIPGRDRGRPKR